MELLRRHLTLFRAAIMAGSGPGTWPAAAPAAARSAAQRSGTRTGGPPAVVTHHISGFCFILSICSDGVHEGITCLEPARTLGVVNPQCARLRGTQQLPSKQAPRYGHLALSSADRSAKPGAVSIPMRSCIRPRCSTMKHLGLWRVEFSNPMRFGYAPAHPSAALAGRAGRAALPEMIMCIFKT